ncbi:MAG: sodium:solute symporter, partial [Oscillospiraceae bacterium]|nr:sodium:solute symporter [Oscillospiraceae bacterium]
EAVSATPGVFNSFFGPDPLNLLGVVILTSLGTWGLPQMVQKFYAIKSEEAVKTGMVISVIFALVVAGGCYFLGGFGRLFSDVIALAPSGIPVGGYDAIIPTMLSGLPDIMIAVVVILVLSASMSTLSSLVLASASTITIDFIKDNFVKKMDEKKQVLFIRVFVVIFILISAAIAVFQYRSSLSAVSSNSATFIAQLMGVSWGALAGAFLAPFLYGLYWKKTTRAACWVSFLFGSVLMLLNMLFRGSFPPVLRSPINCGAFAMLAGLVIVPLVSALTPKPDKAMVDDAFACYDIKVPVSQKRSLID